MDVDAPNTTKYWIEKIQKTYRIWIIPPIRLILQSREHDNQLLQPLMFYTQLNR